MKSPLFLRLWKTKIEAGFVIIFKRVSSTWKTQEGTQNETEWKIGTKVTIKKWKPENAECGEGKFHACSCPVHCNEFRNVYRDRYIAVKVHVDDLYDWPGDKQYPTKIAFRSGEVLYECDVRGKKIDS